MKINCNNDYDTLKSVIVGKGFELEELNNIDISFKAMFYDNLYKTRITDHENYKDIVRNELYIEEMTEDVDSFANLLMSCGIKVYRPDEYKNIQKIQTPNWISNTHPALMVRDQAIVIGKYLIETPPCIRYRYFENELLYDIFKLHFLNDDEMKWIKAPPSKMLDCNFDLYKKKEFININNINQNPENFDMMWDGPQCLRFDNNILFNVNNKNHELSVRWLRQILPSSYNIEVIDIADSHLDSYLVPIKEGVMLVNYYFYDTFIKQIPSFLKNWEFVKIKPKEYAYDYKELDIKLASSAIESLNILSISPDKIICDSSTQSILQKKLNKYNIECIPCRIRHGGIFNGSFHCLTLDLWRESNS